MTRKIRSGMMTSWGNIMSQLSEMLKQSLNEISLAKTSAELYEVKVKYFGKNGSITAEMKSMGALSPEEKKAKGAELNLVKTEFEIFYSSRETALKQSELNLKLQSEFLDLTLPGPQQTIGSKNPITIVTDEIFSIMSRLGYSIRTGPMIEKDYYNFEALNIPANHPARDMQDTFFVDKSHVLRTHTSPIQIHSMESEKLPLRIVGTGGVFRCDSDISHLPHFHQIEGMCIDQKISMADLKGTISYFVSEFFGSGLKTRFRPSFFPFTEPSAEVDCSCPICKGEGCSLCNRSGWIEIGGCGLINPKVLKHANVDYPKWQGFAFGFGIERMAIIKYGIDDIRHFPENDIRFLKQFSGV